MPQRIGDQGRKKSASLLKKGCRKGVIVLVVCTAIAILNRNPQQAPEKIFPATLPEVEVIAVENGYGYQIVYGSTVIVRQEFIPVIQGRKPFASAREAKEVANLVKNKLVNNENPGISIMELEALQIIN